MPLSPIAAYVQPFAAAVDLPLEEMLRRLDAEAAASRRNDEAVCQELLAVKARAAAEEKAAEAAAAPAAPVVTHMAPQPVTMPAYPSAYTSFPGYWSLPLGCYPVAPFYAGRDSAGQLHAVKAAREQHSIASSGMPAIANMPLTTISIVTEMPLAAATQLPAIAPQ